MSATNPLLFWTLFVYFAVVGLAAVGMEFNRGRASSEPREKGSVYMVRALIAFAFCVALGVARW